MTLVALVALTLTAMGQAGQIVKPIPEGIYSIQYTAQPDYVLTVKNGQIGDGNPLSVEKWNGSKAQQWKITVQNNCIVIRSMLDNNYVVDVSEYTPIDGREVYIFSFHGDTNQQWRIKSQGGSKVELLSEADHSFALTVVSGGKVQTYKDNGKNSQIWNFHRVDGTTSTTPTTPSTGSRLPSLPEEPKLVKIPNGIYYIINPGEDFPLTLKKNGNAYSIGIEKRHRDKSQQWKVTNNNDGSVTIRSVMDPSYVIVVGGEMKDGTRIGCGRSSNQSGEHWFVYKHRHNVYTLKSAKDQKFVLRKNGKKGYAILRQLRKEWDQENPWDWNEQWNLERVDIKPDNYYTDTDMSKYYRFFGHSFQILVTGSTDGQIWGDNKQNGYMERSDLGTAAVHAGILKPGETAVLNVGIAYGWYKYWETTGKYNIKSKPYGWGRARYWIKSKAKRK